MFDGSAFPYQRQGSPIFNMQQRLTTYDQVFQRFHSLLMIVLLVWLTVSTPIVYEVQQDYAAMQDTADESDSTGPFSGTTEEKAEAGSSTLSEYLHEQQHYQPAFSEITSSYKFHPDDLYSAFHPEQLSPPPEHQL